MVITRVVPAATGLDASHHEKEIQMLTMPSKTLMILHLYAVSIFSLLFWSRTAQATKMSSACWQ